MLGTIISSVIGAAGGIIGGKMQSDSAEDRMNDTNAFNAQQAQLNRDWQERMSNSAWQRGMSDMRTAGLNPILAYGKGGASVPGGDSASGVIISPENYVGEAIQQGVSTAMAKERLDADIEKVKAETDRTKQDEAVGRTQYWLNNKMFQKLNQDIGVAEAEENNKRLVGKILESEEVSARAAAARDSAAEEFYDTPVGRRIRQLGIAIKDLSPFLGAATSAKGLVTK